MAEKQTDEPSKTGKSSDAQPILPWDNFQEWIHCLCIVTFDLELGQAMEVFSILLSPFEVL